MFGLGLKTAALIKIGVAAIAVVVLLCTIFFHFGKREGKAETEVGALKNAFTRIQDMEKNNASFRALPARDRCLLYAYHNGMSGDVCDD